MRIAHSQSTSSARAHELNTITFTYYATSIPRSDLHVVLRVPGEPTLISLRIQIRRKRREQLPLLARGFQITLVELSSLCASFIALALQHKNQDLFDLLPLFTNLKSPLYDLPTLKQVAIDYAKAKPYTPPRISYTLQYFTILQKGPQSNQFDLRQL